MIPTPLHTYASFIYQCSNTHVVNKGYNQFMQMSSQINNEDKMSKLFHQTKISKEGHILADKAHHPNVL